MPKFGSISFVLRRATTAVLSSLTMCNSGENIFFSSKSTTTLQD